MLSSCQNLDETREELIKMLISSSESAYYFELTAITFNEQQGAVQRVLSSPFFLPQVLPSNRFSNLINESYLTYRHNSGLKKVLPPPLNVFQVKKMI